MKKRGCMDYSSVEGGKDNWGKQMSPADQKLELIMNKAA